MVTIHAPLLDKTQNLITGDVLKLMGSQGVLVNAARGKIVNENHLADCLENGSLGGAAFDVFATEPLPEDSRLRKLDNFIMTPHLGASTVEAQSRVGQMVVEQLKTFFGEGRVLNQVSSL